MLNTVATEKNLTMFQIVTNQEHGSLWLIFCIGIAFGLILQYSKVHTFEKIAGFAMLKDTVILKLLLLSIGLSSIGLYFLVQAGYASYHIKPFSVGGVVIGGIVFGMGMAIFGKCPGTIAISLAEGRFDTLVGTLGGVLGGYVFTKYYDEFATLITKPLAYQSLFLDFQSSFVGVLVFGIVLAGVSFAIPLKEEMTND